MDFTIRMRKKGFYEQNGLDRFLQSECFEKCFSIRMHKHRFYKQNEFKIDI